MRFGPGRDPRGKLKAAARAWAGGRGGAAAIDQDDALAQAGPLPPWMTRRAARETGIELAPDEVEAFSLFVSLGTQWRWHPTAGLRLGLIYEAVEPAAKLLGIEVTPAMFTDLRMMEGAAIEASLARA